MTLDTLEMLLKTTNYPTKYSHFDVPTTFPRITYLVVGTNNVLADNVIYKKINSYRVELYTQTKDLSAEQKVESVLENAGIIYVINKVYINSEKVYLIIYEFEEME